MISDSQMMRLLAKEAKLLEAYRFRGCLPDARPATDTNIHRYIAALAHDYATGTRAETEIQRDVSIFFTQFTAANQRADITEAIANIHTMPLDAQLRLGRAVADRLPLEDCLLTAAANRTAAEKPMGMATLLQSFEKEIGEHAFDHWLPSQHSLTVLSDLLHRDVNGTLRERLKIKERFWSERNKAPQGERPYFNLESANTVNSGQYTRVRLFDVAPTVVKTRDEQHETHCHIYDPAKNVFHPLTEETLEGEAVRHAHAAHMALLKNDLDLQTHAMLLTVYEPSLAEGAPISVYFRNADSPEVFAFLCQNGYSSPFTHRMGEQVFEYELMECATIYSEKRIIRQIDLNYHSQFEGIDTFFTIPIFIGSLHDSNKIENANYLKLLEASYDNPVLVLNHPSPEMLNDFVERFMDAFDDLEYPPNIHMHVNGHHNKGGYFVFGDQPMATVIHDKEIVRAFNKIATNGDLGRDNILLLSGCGMDAKNVPYVNGTTILIGGPDEFTFSHARNNEYRRVRQLPPGHEMVPSLAQYSDLASIMRHADNSPSIASSKQKNHRQKVYRRHVFREKMKHDPTILPAELVEPMGYMIRSDPKRVKYERDMLLDKWLGTIENSLYLQSQNDPTQWVTVIAPSDIGHAAEPPVPPFVVELAQLQGDAQRKELLKQLEQYGCKVFDIPETKQKRAL